MRGLAFIVLSIMLLSMVSAAYGANIEVNGGVMVGKSNDSDDSNSNGIGVELSGNVRAGSELKEGDYTLNLGQTLNVKDLSADLRELRIGNISVKTKLNITSEEENNKIKLKAHLSNGANAEIKVIPDAASETAIVKLGINSCSQENNCTIELKEVAVKSQAHAAYNVKVEKDVKVIGLFRAKMNLEANVDAETGEIISVKVPWWNSISSETKVN